MVFTFEAESFSSLEKLQEEGDYPSLAETVEDSLKILWAVQKQAKQGYTELIVRNPSTDDEKLILDYECKGIGTWYFQSAFHRGRECNLLYRLVSAFVVIGAFSPLFIAVGVL